ncbi:cation:proton antiporter [Solitalea canadensis]|uniref:NhaP-type Na+(K+)/H+ antiporter n=1 Tax=Solitalea canadensis (strain ATCC 29591 / DSM 3403 / JCM 21819 / LMG 8368 / NBRC 15130 / NCIMB 12057 / USAM 9D) TaxID=929556 RepID=H8KQE2_SOLCM|nr:sodium:proton antiporter [Solitalea canadensis]AFD06558.1 NhaP-type Na+(K+)/H+ antiporter [Solitalea canadensis DSM 3403]
MDVLQLITLLLLVSAGISYINQRFIKLPGTIGIVAISVVISVIIVIVGKTNNELAAKIREASDSMNFSSILLDVMLGFLLFASALHFDYQKLRKQQWPVFALSTLGVLLSTFLFGIFLYYLAGLFGINLPLIYCFIFGALISPTDPIAVGSILKRSKISEKLSTVIAGESLFNDAVGLLVFILLLELVQKPGVVISFNTIAGLIIHEVLGGIVIGLAIGYVGYMLIKSIKDFQTILLISIALVLGISMLAGYFHASVPLVAVTAGLIIGNNSFHEDKVSDDFLLRIWKLIDEVLNTILFVMIGLQMVAMPFLREYWLLSLFAIMIILIARIISVSLPALFLLGKVNFNNLFILSWAGLRGGISIAMALSLPDSPYKEGILSGCYFIVLFSIIVQGLSLNKLITVLKDREA